jgi:hypothetical protein
VPLEDESTLYQQKLSQVYVNDGDAEMKEANQNTSQHAYKKTKINHNKDNEDLDDLLEPKVEEMSEQKIKKPPKLDPPDLVKRAGTYSIVEDMMHTKVNITYSQLLGNPSI